MQIRCARERVFFTRLAIRAFEIMSKRLPRPGDVIRIGEFAGRLIIGHYVMADEDNGPLIQFFSCDMEWSIETGIPGCKELFCTYVGVNPPIRSGRWQILGRITPPKHLKRKFLMQGLYGKEERPTWWLYEDGKEKFIGADVPHELQELEVLSVWPWELLEDRFESGIDFSGYRATIERYEEELAERQTGLR